MQSRCQDNYTVLSFVLLSFIIFMRLQDTSAIWDKDVSLMATEILSDCSKDEVECLFSVKLKI